MSFRAGFVALLGRPNVGKSTLVNALLGEKVAIVSPKAQTTRTRIHGMLNRPESQIILVDTPGLGPTPDALRRAMRRITGQAAADADVSLVLLQPHGSGGPTEAELEVLETARLGRGPVVVALNKIDLLERKEQLLPWMSRLSSEPGVRAVVPISALEKEGLEPLCQELEKLLPESEPLFPKDLHTDQAERFLCSELVREQLLWKLREEVPHTAAVVIESFEDERDDKGNGLCRLEGRIIVERDSQKGIVVGKGGAMIKAVSTAARQQIEEVLGCKIYLRLTVHVDPKWTENEQRVRDYGVGEGS